MARAPLFTLTVVGSWPRPRWLLEALRARRDRRISQEEFDAIFLLLFFRLLLGDSASAYAQPYKILPFC